MTLNIAIQMDPIGSLDLPHQTTWLLMREALSRGHKLFYYPPNRLSLKDGEVIAQMQSLKMKEEAPFYSLGQTIVRSLMDMDVLLVRQDPPMNMAYVSSTYILEKIHGKTLVVNNPFQVRNNPDKFFPLQFPEFIPPTLVSNDNEAIRAFHREHGELVIKPLYGHDGNGIFYIDKNGTNLLALMELLSSRSHEPWLIQKFLPEVRQQERRIFLIDGAIAGYYARIPGVNEIRADPQRGGRAESTELTARQRQVAETVGAVCRKKELYFVGLDMIGEYLIEINTTSVGGFHRLHQIYGSAPEAIFWEGLERRFRSREKLQIQP